ncbi:F-actin-capping protein subunit beta [Turdus rufiventris]|nr:F-actin-capping protein subunit beta [Turdus rufiventris]
MFTAGRRRKRTGRGVEATGTDREAPPFYRPAHPPSRHGGSGLDETGMVENTSYQVNTKLIKSCQLKELGFGSSPVWETACLITCSESRAAGASSWSDQQLDCALDLMRRLPPQQIEKNLSDLIDLVPSLCEDLLSSVDQPLKIARDKVVGKDYLLCDYNRDGDSYRSPWSNKYDPPLEDGAMPSARLRKLEVEANNAFDQYRDLYFEGGVSSVYLWDLDHGFAGVILIKKAGDGSKKIKGCWDSIHVVEVQEKSSGRTAHYKLTSTVMLWLQTNKTGSGTMNLGGSLTRQQILLRFLGLMFVVQQLGCVMATIFTSRTLGKMDFPLAQTVAWMFRGAQPDEIKQMEKDETVSDSSPHIANIGRLVEDMENKIRSTLNEIYFGKTKDIVNGLRSIDAIPDNQKYKQLQRELSQVLTQRQIYIQPDN